MGVNPPNNLWYWKKKCMFPHIPWKPWLFLFIAQQFPTKKSWGSSIFSFKRLKILPLKWCMNAFQSSFSIVLKNLWERAPRPPLHTWRFRRSWERTSSVTLPVSHSLRIFRPPPPNNKLLLAPLPYIHINETKYDEVWEYCPWSPSSQWHLVDNNILRYLLVRTRLRVLWST